MADRRWGVWHEADRTWHATLVERHERWSRRMAQQEGHSSSLQQTQVPHRIHQIWLGPREIPPKCLAWMQTFPAQHASWEYRLWTDENVRELFPLRNQKAFDAAKNYGEKSDILRYEILLAYGGVYADVDVECLRPFDALAKTCAFAVGVSNTAAFELNNGVMVSVPGHRILRELIQRIYTQSHKPQLDTGMLALIAQMSGESPGLQQLMSSELASDGPMGTIERTGPGLLTRTFMDAVGWRSESHARAGFLTEEQSERVVALPTEVFYPLRNDKSLRLSEIASPVLTVHYWERTWITE